MLSKWEYRRRLVWIWAFGVVGLGVIFGRVSCWRFFRLDQDGVVMTATVTGMDPDSRDPVRYAYDASGSRYDGEGNGGYGNPGLAGIKVGDRLRGFYDAGDPSRSCLGDPGPRLWRHLGFALLWSFLIPSLIVFRASRRYGQWLRRQEAEKKRVEGRRDEGR